MRHPLVSLEEWKSVVFPTRNTFTDSDSLDKNQSIEMAVRLAKKSIESVITKRKAY